MTSDPIAATIIGRSAPIVKLRALIAKVGPTALPVLIHGPTGSGKELVARALHLMSGRDGALVSFNVCAIAETMFEDALFGHVRGAFTGAVADTQGYLAEANGGTVFFDEISGLPPAQQLKLLRVIETREFRPIGARRDRSSEFRVVAASNENPQLLVGLGRLRADLAHRLASVVISVPPLVARLEDVPALAEHFAARCVNQGREPARFDNRALLRLRQHLWPGNVRELRNVVECCIALSQSRTIKADDISEVLMRTSIISDQATLVARRQRLRIIALLSEHDGDTGEVASRLGIARATLYRWMSALGIPTPKRVTRRVSHDTGWLPAAPGLPYARATDE